MHWTDEERDAWRRGRNLEIREALWEFMKAVGRIDARGCYLDTERLDVVDLTPEEIVQLVKLARSATRVGDLAGVSDVAARLRLDGRVMDMTTFEALMLRSEIAPARPAEPESLLLDYNASETPSGFAGPHLRKNRLDWSG